MDSLFEKMDVKDWLDLNAKLQKKKNALRKDLAEKGVLEKKGLNDYDKYKYFSEAQYKELFTDLFCRHGLELNFNELDYTTFEGTGKNANGRMPRLQFYLYDIDTGFYETTVITGEGMDKGDKAGYKAYTGALKYYLADKFMVATGDDPENESPENKMNQKVGSAHQSREIRLSSREVGNLKALAVQAGITVDQICSTFKVESLQDMTEAMYVRATQMLEAERRNKEANI